MKPKKLGDQVATLEGELSRIQGAMTALQRDYEGVAQERETLLALERRLASYRLPDTNRPTWVGVCLAMGWPGGGRGAHGTVKRLDPPLHALLHLCVFDHFCALERVTYAP
jgi:hypothetical protein